MDWFRYPKFSEMKPQWEHGPHRSPYETTSILNAVTLAKLTTLIFHLTVKELPSSNLLFTPSLGINFSLGNSIIRSWLGRIHSGRLSSCITIARLIYILYVIYIWIHYQEIGRIIFYYTPLPYNGFTIYGPKLTRKRRFKFENGGNNNFDHLADGLTYGYGRLRI